ncbi:RING finger and SPRY domain-containing protein 1 [Cephus cinctus]|uniref:RING finger and SPRY domain-containing protein 1 n=1 Tax=Cephus cinctus TaxID=211228 RepID=A0AAJ7RUT3_CEPCN|nr:RING finger and SPRY domain-containing protein 1 [Cephus cinctus]XP_015606950.1 RING finger and SPRY domain-containing protein 1 [Cephus cinctus]XP_015606959.1 RING finger and SPRY domain-containing protein 1 [Cephus cinctus]XP_015606967.1 RING finger and SPRY domain-containing protein 1 [Cephus cinctus]XP_015606976.1 RING finger and SPRY domain-containing protein 1 [Cephus cinctus]XP_015606984.1 RING finger and SPRY domain-containing protein 1 [Cephus cinctus]XP_024946834.1 RING finger an
MGNCLCKDTSEDDDAYRSHNHAQSGNTVLPVSNVDAIAAGDGSPPSLRFPISGLVDRLVLETLGVIGTLVDNEQEPPPAMLKLHAIADKEDGWIQVVSSMVNVIPMHNPLGPSVITLLLDDCPLPSKDSVLRLAHTFQLSKKFGKMQTNATQQRNICVVLGCIAEKLAGPSSIAILSDATLDYLVSNLKEDIEPYVVLYSLIALEKFAQTSENKLTIKKRLLAEKENPLLELEKWATETHYVRRQVGFCAQWCLDNLFLMEGRKYSHDTVDMTGINVMLNTKDVSEYLKISPNGLEARCDAYSFESVRCTFQVDSGVWYYETLIITTGVMQIGWATKDSTFLNHEGYGIGDDEFSLAYDGCRRLIWHSARSEKYQERPCWKAGDVLGCLLDLKKLEIIFSLNGIPLKPCVQVFKTAKSGFFAAASFMSFQQCLFNFGNVPFKYPPTDREYQKFNDYATLNPEDKIVLPRHIYLDQLRKLSVREDSCTLCFDRKASVRLLPCDHRGFCPTCSKQLIECPMCRATIEEVALDNT